MFGNRKGFSTQDALLSLIEKWKKVLDNKGYSGVILMDLSKAFNTINHDLLIAKSLNGKEQIQVLVSRRRYFTSITGICTWTNFV